MVVLLCTLQLTLVIQSLFFTPATFDTVSFTNYTDIDSQLCFKCGFLAGSTSLGCNVSLTEANGNFKEYYEVKKVSDDDVIAIRCPVKSPPAGVYNICVSDIDRYTTQYTRCAIFSSFVHLNKSGKSSILCIYLTVHVDICNVL